MNEKEPKGKNNNIPNIIVLIVNLTYRRMITSSPIV